MKENGPDDHIKIPGTKGWFLKGGMMGDLELEIVGIKAGFDARAIAGLIALIARRAGIGAKTQMGYGIVQFKEQAPPAQPFENHLKGLGTGTYAPSDLPDLREMFFAEMKTSKVVSRQKDNVKPTLLLKRDLRAAFRGCLRDNYKDRTLRHELMGEVRGNSRIGSKISISQPFDSGSGPVMRMWGWVPEYLAVRAGVSRCDVLDRIKGVVPSSALLTWEEMDPSKVPSFLGI
jgi:CRISPR-associated protein Cmr1